MSFSLFDLDTWEVTDKHVIFFITFRFNLACTAGFNADTKVRRFCTEHKLFGFLKISKHNIKLIFKIILNKITKNLKTNIKNEYTIRTTKHFFKKNS